MPGVISLSLSKAAKTTKSGRTYPFWVIRASKYDKEIRATRTKYFAYVGTEPILSESKAKEICEKKGITMENLRRTNRLQIVPDDELEERKQAWLKEQAKEKGGDRDDNEKT